MSILNGLAEGAADRVRQRLDAWQEARVSQRIWERDFTLWGLADGTELTDRLGWLEAPSKIKDFAPKAVEVATAVRGAGIRWVVLMGMGGSSLAPEVFQSVLGRGPGAPEIILLDSTHPDAVTPVLERCAAGETLAIVASKSGSTIETMSLFHIFWERAVRELDSPGDHFIAITDPDTSLGALASERNFRAVFISDPNVGGRYSALTPFGLVPTALIGGDLDRLAASSERMANACSAETNCGEHPGLTLAAVLIEASLMGRDKLTLLTSELWSAFPIWIEQLVAESLGKDGRGVVPVGEESGAAGIPWGSDRCFAVLRTSTDEKLAAEAEALREQGHPVLEWLVDDPVELAAEMYRWEFAVGAAAIGLEVHPFDQPDVQIAKVLAKEAMAAGGATESSAGDFVDVASDDLGSACDRWLDQLVPGEYLGLQAYVPANAATDAVLERLRRGLRDRHGLVVTVGYGPRFLHSTGQLHKGGANIGRFLQVFSSPQGDLEVPTTDYTLGRLVRAQADGDAGALLGRERKVLRVMLSGASGWETLATALGVTSA